MAKVWLITGSGNGLRRDIAEAALAAGNRVVAGARRTEELAPRATGVITEVSEIGRAMVTGKCADIGKFKGPILRGLAGRAPYFHNGSAATLSDAVDFCNTRCTLHLSQPDKDDVVAFLKTL
jgi:cytochrome c peroxidase